ncbi:hypothetical protein KKG71_00615 [Patescibacteria group bacterium]|nr:hypothetical protein [Patescibacteria group bacterium]
MLKSILTEVIGLSDLEVKIYMTLLNLGPQPASIIAAKADCPRTSTYPVLERLVQKGIVTYFLKRKVKYFNAVSLDKLDSKLKEKEDSCNAKAKVIGDNRNKLKHYFKIFQNNSSESQISKANVQTFIGLESAKTMWYILLAEKSTIYNYGYLDKSLLDSKQEEWFQHMKKTLKSHKKEIRIILSDDMRKGLINNEDPDSKRMIRVVPESVFPLKNCQICISGSYYGYFANTSGIIYGILINDKQLADMQKMLFTGFWKMTKNYEKKLTNV